MSSSAARTVLAGVLRADERSSLVEMCARLVSTKHFTDPTLEQLYGAFMHYRTVSGGVVTRNALEQMAAVVDDGTKTLWLETYDVLVSQQPTDSEVTWAAHQLRQERIDRETKRVFREAADITVNECTDSNGNVLKGSNDAREFAQNALAMLEREAATADAPGGDIRREHTEIIGDYVAAKKDRGVDKPAGARFGLETIDSYTGGLRRGELVLVAGASGQGKTSSMIQLAWNASVVMGLSVVVFTSETLRAAIRRRIICRHSCSAKFKEAGYLQGLDASKMRDGGLDPKDEQLLALTVDDYRSNSDYGSCYVAQVPSGASVDTVEGLLNVYSRSVPVDLVIIDYLALLRAGTKRQSTREELSATVIAAKQMATAHAKGKGVAVVSPWQINRSSQEQADKSSAYTLRSLAETSEATNTSDLIIAMIETSARQGRKGDVTLSILKNRDGPTVTGVKVGVDYATCEFSERQRVSASSEGFGVVDQSIIDSVGTFGL